MNLAPVAEAEERLYVTLAAMTDAEAAAPSRLPGWTRAMVATHIARNADSNARMVEAALRGEVRAQYPGGPTQRAEDIEAGRGHSAADLLADNRAAAAEWHAAFRSVTDWDVLVPAGVGMRPISQRVRSRLLEVEVHHADLGLVYSFRDWPVEFAEDQLARRLDSIASAPPAVAGRWSVGGRVVGEGESEGAVEGDPRALLAWLMGREGTASLTVTGDARVAAMPEWYPFA